MSLNPLGPLDQMFLWLERRHQPMQVGVLELFSPPPGAPADWLYDQVEHLRAATQAQPPFNLREELLFELSRLCLGDELADAYQLPRHKGWQQAVRLYQLANKASTLAHYRLPGFDRLSETLNFRLIRKALVDNLDANPEKRAFRHIA